VWNPACNFPFLKAKELPLFAFAGKNADIFKTLLVPGKDTIEVGHGARIIMGCSKLAKDSDNNLQIHVKVNKNIKFSC